MQTDNEFKNMVDNHITKQINQQYPRFCYCDRCGDAIKIDVEITGFREICSACLEMFRKDLALLGAEFGLDDNFHLDTDSKHQNLPWNEISGFHIAEVISRFYYRTTFINALNTAKQTQKG